jgi:peptide/nickel transport system substrate-binding protein
MMAHPSIQWRLPSISDRIVNPEIASQKARYLLGNYSGYEIVDDYTIRLIVAKPYAPLLDSLSQVYLGMASPTALTQHSTERYQFNQVGTGPFIFLRFYSWRSCYPAEKSCLCLGTCILSKFKH